MKEKFLLRLSANLKTKLQAHAREQDMTLTALIVQVLWDYVKNQDGKEKSAEKSRPQVLGGEGEDEKKPA